MLWIDVKYANIVGNRLQLFKVKKQNPYVANFRCFVCGDSQKNKFKARGYFFTKGQKVIFSCHNCGSSKSLPGVLQELDLQLFNEYKLENLSNKDHVARTEEFSRPIFAFDDVLKNVRKISSLPYDHPAKRYVERRCIPTLTHFKLYYTPKFNRWVNSLLPGKLDEDHDEPRLVLPFITPDGKVYGFQGRAFHDKSIRYITIMLDENKPRIFGWEAIKHDKMVNVVEGPIDSLFIDNCVAMAGSDSDIEQVENDRQNVRIIYDNEPRNPQIVKRIAKAIQLGYNVFLWPDGIQAKDINDYVKESKIDRPTLMRFLEANTYTGLRAMAKFTQWSKC